MTSPFRQHDRQHSVNVTVPLVRPSADTRLLVSAAAQAVGRHFRPGFNYAKAGVMLIDLSELGPAGQQQGELDLFAQEPDAPVAGVGRDRAGLMQAIDALNRRYGRGSVQIGSASLAASNDAQRSWSTRQERRSPRYTTRWEEMPVVRA
jgi:DNA polymerase V